MTELTIFKDVGSLTGLMDATNTATGGGFGAGIMLTVFVVSFYRLSGIGYLQAYVASSFTTTILSFILASISLLPAELPFLIAAASLGGLMYMYMIGRV